jgi:hypothetical protein
VYNFWLVTLAIFGSLLLVINVLVALGFFNFSDLNSLMFNAMSSIVLDIIFNLVYFIIGGEVYLVSSLESSPVAS